MTKIKGDGYKVLAEEFSKGTQSINFTGLYEFVGDKLRIVIKRDSSDSQSSARIYCYDKDKNSWNFMESVPFSNMNVVKNDVFYQKTPSELSFTDKANFDLDKYELLTKAILILK